MGRWGPAAWEAARRWPRRRIIAALDAHAAYDARQRDALIDALALTNQIDTGTESLQAPDPSHVPKVSSAPFVRERTRLRELITPGAAAQIEWLREVERLRAQERRRAALARELSQQPVTAFRRPHEGQHERDGAPDLTPGAERPDTGT